MLRSIPVHGARSQLGQISEALDPQPQVERRTIAVRVLSPTGRPLPGALVKYRFGLDIPMVMSRFGESKVTDAEGRVVFTDVPVSVTDNGTVTRVEDYTFEAESGLYEPGRQTVRADSVPEEVVVTMKNPTLTTGQKALVGVGVIFGLSAVIWMIR